MKTITRIIDQEIRHPASQLVQDITSGCGGLQWIEYLAPVLDVEDLSEPPPGYQVAPDVDDPELWRWFTPSDSCEPLDCWEDAIRDAWEDAGEDVPKIEVYEHWIVSDWLAEKLEEIGAPVVRDILGFNIWGRTETGQSLDLDETLAKVAGLVGPMRTLDDVVWFARRTRQRCVILENWTFQIDSDSVYYEGTQCDGLDVIGEVTADSAVLMRVPVCSYCGSREVTRDGLLHWDTHAQRWEGTSPLDNADCNECGGQTSLYEDMRGVNI